MSDEKRDPALEKLLASLGAAGGLDELDDDTLAELSDRLKTVRSRRRRPSAPKLPARALALDALDVLTVPSTPRMIASVVEARTGNPFDARALTTARRDDREAWRREAKAGKTPAPKLAPALHHELIEPVRALVTNSAWDLARRMVTPHSPRADHPAAVLALLEEADRIAEIDAGAAERVGALACRLAAGIPGAPAFDSTASGRDAVRRAAAEEAARFAELAADERASAAQRAHMVDPEARIWGRGSSSSTSSRRSTRG